MRTWFRSRWLHSLLGLVLLPAPVLPAFAHSDPFDRGSDFAWRIFPEGGMSEWRVLDREELERLKKRYDGEFLYFRDETGRYVVTDPGLVQEAKKAPREIEKHQDVIRSLANAEARLTVSKLGQKDEIERLESKMRGLEKEIEELERAGEPTDRLERKRFETSVHIQALRSMSEENRLTKDEEKALMRQRDAASSRLKEVERIIDGKVRKVAETAKRKGLAERQP